jgi:phosphoribosylformylglycinamidine (FGAM) synthase-like amidotransferase family enzyme
MLSNRRFKRMFRLSRNAFWSLRELIRTTRNAYGCGAVRVPVESRLSMTLRYLAGGSYLDVAIAHHVSISTFYYVVDETLNDLDQSLNIKFPIDNLKLLKR